MNNAKTVLEIPKRWLIIIALLTAIAGGLLWLLLRHG